MERKQLRLSSFAKSVRPALDLRESERLRRLRASDGTLQELYVSQVQHPRVGRLYLDALCTNSSVKAVYISGLGSGADVRLAPELRLSLAQVFKRNPSITELSLGSLRIDEGTSQILTEILFNTGRVNSFSLSGGSVCPMFASALVDHAPITASLQRLRVDPVIGLPPEWVLLLAHNLQSSTTLKELDLSHYRLYGEIGRQFAELLAQNRSIVELHLHRTHLGGDAQRADAGVLAGLLRRNAGITILGAGLNGFLRQDTRVLAEAAAASATLTSLDLSDNTLDLYELSQALSRNRSVTRLDLSPKRGQFYSLDEIEALISALPWLRDLALHDSNLDFCLQPSSFALLVNSALTVLDVSNNKLGEQRMRAFAEAAATAGTQLQNLMLGACEIGDEGGTFLAKALDVSPCLTRLELSCNDISEHSLKELAPTFVRSQSLKELVLETFSITRSGMVRIFAEVLRANSSITRLHFDNPDEKSALDWSPLRDAMQVNTTLLDLDVGCDELPTSPERRACEHFLFRNAQPQLLLQLRSGQKERTWKLDFLRMSGAVAASLEVEETITAGALRELVEAAVPNVGRVIVLLPTGERLHRVPQERPVAELLQ